MINLKIGDVVELTQEYGPGNGEAGKRTVERVSNGTVDLKHPRPDWVGYRDVPIHMFAKVGDKIILNME